MFGMVASAAVLFGMGSCSHKAESENSAAEGEVVEEQSETVAPQEPVMEEENIAEAGLVAEEIPQQVAAEEARKEEVKAAENKASNGYITTASGLKYKVIKKGTGKKPKATDTVKVNYEGKLTDGTVFDSSYKHGQPITFPLNRVIPGWTEGVQLMPEGSVYEFYIPYNLAYGDGGVPGVIPPKADLIFKVELLEIQ